jgi:hypothetical protein
VRLTAREPQVHRAPLPLAALAAAGRAAAAAPTLRLHVLRLLDAPPADAAAAAQQLAARVAAALEAAAEGGAPRERFAVSASVAAPDGCAHADADAAGGALPPPVPRWSCDNAAEARGWRALSDAALDDVLQARVLRARMLAHACLPALTRALQAHGGDDAAAGAYTLLLLPGDTPCDAAAVVYGTHRTAWARCDGTHAGALGAAAAARFGGAAGGVAAPPVSAEGSLRLEFALCNAAPRRGYHFTWDFAAAAQRFVAPLAAALAPLCALRFGSTVLLHTAAAGEAPRWDATLQAHLLDAAALPQLVDPEWPLHAPGGAPAERVLQLVAYVPPARHCPLALPLSAPGFTSPGWGAVALFNPPGCGANGTSGDGAASRELSSGEMRSLMALFASQLRVLLGLPATPGDDVVSARVAAFAAWEVDALSRRAAAAHAAATAESLGALGRVVAAQRNMAVSDAIAQLAGKALHAHQAAASAAADGRHADAAEAATRAHAAAEGAFFHPSILSLLYFPSDHKLAVYLPLFLPTLLPLALAALREARHRRCRAAFAAAYRAEHKQA